MVKICPVKISVRVLLLPCWVTLHGKPFLLGKGGRGILGSHVVFRVNSGGDLTWPTEYKRMT